MTANLETLVVEQSPELDYRRVEAAIESLLRRRHEQPSLAAVARDVGLSAAHFQRLFQRWAGISPKRFLQVVTAVDAKRLLEERRSTLQTSIEIGLSGPSRLHDLFLRIEQMTPGQYARRAQGVAISWATAATPFGAALFAATERGLCHVGFLGVESVEHAVAALQKRWPEASLRQDASAVAAYAAELGRRIRGAPASPIGVVLKGTPMQLSVWQALLQVPRGALVTYGEVASCIAAPRAARAVGSAIGANPLAYLIPCHRVLRATGVLGGYRWGELRKRAMLGFEHAHTSLAPAS